MIDVKISRKYYTYIIEDANNNIKATYEGDGEKISLKKLEFYNNEDNLRKIQYYFF